MLNNKQLEKLGWNNFCNEKCVNECLFAPFNHTHSLKKSLPEKCDTCSEEMEFLGQRLIKQVEDNIRVLESVFGCKNCSRPTDPKITKVWYRAPFV